MSGMSNRLRKPLITVALCVALVLLCVAFSAFHARRICDATVGAEIAPPPRYSTRFALYPSRHMEGADDVGLMPGWIVTYAPRTKSYGSAFCVSFFGKMLARGTPLMVTKQKLQAKQGVENFQRAFAEVDAVVQVGTTFSNAVALLGEPIATFTNGDRFVEAHFNYMPRDLGQIRIDWLTNGFTLLVSNGIILRKTYSYTSSR